MMRLELVDRYGRTTPYASYESEQSAGVMTLMPEVFGWPDGWSMRCTVTQPVTPEVPPAEGTPE